MKETLQQIRTKCNAGVNQVTSTLSRIYCTPSDIVTAIQKAQHILALRCRSLHINWAREHHYWTSDEWYYIVERFIFLAIDGIRWRIVPELTDPLCLLWFSVKLVLLYLKKTTGENEVCLDWFCIQNILRQILFTPVNLHHISRQWCFF